MAKAKAASSSIDGPVENAEGGFDGPALQSPTEGVSRHDEESSFEPTAAGDPSGGGMRGPDPGVDPEALEAKQRDAVAIVKEGDEAFGEAPPAEEPPPEEPVA